MTIEKLYETKEETERFLARLEKTIAVAEGDEASQIGKRTSEVASLKRASLDLSRALVGLRTREVA